jgi:hypothetical protein
MKILRKIPIRWNIAEIKKELHWRDRPGTSVDLPRLIKDAGALVRTRIVYKVSYIQKKEKDKITIEGVTFSSKVLQKNLETVERVFPFIITIGKDLERYASGCHDLLQQYYLEGLADIALGKAAQYLEQHLKRWYGLTGLSSMSPGSLEDWPISQQKLLFSLFGETEKLINVKLTEHLLMIPRKSISGIYFPTEVSFLSCQLCPRKGCPARKAPFDRNFRTKYRLDEES